MKQITLYIKDNSKFPFFMELVKNFDFIEVKEKIQSKPAPLKTDKLQLIKEIKEGVKNVNLAKRGKLKAKPLKDLLDEL